MNYDANAGIEVKRWNGSAWQALGTPRGEFVQAGQPSLALAPNGQPALAYIAQTPGGSQVYFELWDGKRWLQLAGSAQGGGVSASVTQPSGYGASRPSLAFDGHGRPVIAWQHAGLEDGVCCDIHVRVRLFDDGRWLDLGRPSSGTGAHTGSAGAPVLVVDGLGAPLVFWNNQRNGGGSAVFGKRWNGSKWSELAGSATRGVPGSSQNGDPSAAVGPDGNPVVVWPLCPGIAVQGARFNDGWEPFGEGKATCGGQSGLAFPVTVDSHNRPVAVFLAGSGPRTLHVQRWEGGRPVELGALDGKADAASIARQGEDLVVAWSDNTRAVYVMRWDGTAWAPLGNPSGPGRFAPPALVAR
ncbi:hypothetical protein [Hyalangium sp.]|uniref:hypothetical protein n=1 Tax=Hyalangium sp. TaxID=2028555 RepID=UPI00389ACF03